MNKDKPIPPHLATRLLHSFLRDDLLEEVSGDLEERFYDNIKHQSLFKAKLNYWYEVLHYLRPFALRKRKQHHLNHYAMFQNYFKITTRNLLKQKLYSAINIGGLALGLSCFIIILLYVQNEFSYDRFYKNADHIYRVYQKQTGNVFMGTEYFADTPAQLASVIREEFPEVTYATPVEETSGLLSRDDHHFWENGIAGDEQFFHVFPIEFVMGNSKTALSDPKSIVLTTSLAQKIFEYADPIGKSIKYKDGIEYTVTGLINDPPANSILQYSYILNIRHDEYFVDDMKRIGWNNNSVHTFFVLADHADKNSVENKFPALIKKYQLPEDYANYPFKDQYFAQPLPDMYLQSGVNDDLGMKGNRKAVYLFAAVAFIILLLACVNYMNLAIARSIKRSREVGLRKVVGAARRQLISQFLGESILIAFLSLILAIGLAYLLLPAFGHIMERPIALDFTSNIWLIPGLLLLVILVGLFSGSYPAFIMSSILPIQVLKAKADVNVSGISLQRLLIVVQFAASITLVISSVVIYQQIQFMQHKELGYAKDNIITIPLKDRSILDNYQNLSNEWLRHSSIISATASSHLPSSITSSTIIKDDPGSSSKDDLLIYKVRIDYNYLDVFDIKLLNGRNFSKDIKSDEQGCLINESAARALGWKPEEAVGKQFKDDNRDVTILGVVKDFHMHSLHLTVQPLLIQLATDWHNYISIKVKPENFSETIAFIEKTIKKNSLYPFEYRFMDENYKKLYQSEIKLGEIFGFFTIVSILIASLGLFGLAAFMAGQRTKEIGIRKVLGASVNNILMLVSRDFLGLVLLAFLVAIPIGWYAMDKWLQDFAYHINMEWWMFAFAGVLAFFIANITIGYQSFKASMMNPVDSLKSE